MFVDQCVLDGKSTKGNFIRVNVGTDVTFRLADLCK